MEVTTFKRGFGEAEFPVWEKIGAVVRLSYGIGKPPFSIVVSVIHIRLVGCSEMTENTKL